MNAVQKRNMGSPREARAQPRFMGNEFRATSAQHGAANDLAGLSPSSVTRDRQTTPPAQENVVKTWLLF